MKEWKACEVVELDFLETKKQSGNGNGNNDTNTHKGWCEMHKHPENGVCTCGAGNGIVNPS